MADDDLSKIEAGFAIGLIFTVPSVITGIAATYDVQAYYFSFLGGWMIASVCLLVYQHRSPIRRFFAEFREEVEIAKTHGEPPYNTEQIIDEVVEEDDD